MLREFTLQPNEDKRLQVEGRYLVVTQATGAIELSIGGSTPVTVDEKDRIHLNSDSPNDRSIRIRNVSGGVNSIELHTSELLVDKRTGVNVTNSLVIAEDQIIGIDPTANIVQSIIQNDIRIDPNGNAITVEPNQAIGIDQNANGVRAEIQNDVVIDRVNNTVNTLLTAPIEIAQNQTVGIDPNVNTVRAEVQNPIGIDGTVNTVVTAPIEVAQNQTIGIDPNVNTVQFAQQRKQFIVLDNIVFDAVGTSSRRIDDNPLREKLVLIAELSNFLPVWVSGELGNVERRFPIHPGDRIEIDGIDGIDLEATEAQRLYVAEVVTEG